MIVVRKRYSYIQVTFGVAILYIHFCAFYAFWYHGGLVGSHACTYHGGLICSHRNIHSFKYYGGLVGSHSDIRVCGYHDGLVGSHSDLRICIINCWVGWDSCCGIMFVLFVHIHAHGAYSLHLCPWDWYRGVRLHQCIHALEIGIRVFIYTTHIYALEAGIRVFAYTTCIHALEAEIGMFAYITCIRALLG